MAERARHDGRSPNEEYAIGLARAFAGAIIFSLPLLMTMEMWWLGFYMDRSRLLLFSLLNFAMLVGLSRVAGFVQSTGLLEDGIDALAAYGVAVISAGLVLTLFGIITPDMPVSEITGKIAVQAIPASLGAMLGRKQLGGSDEAVEKVESSYGGQLFLMLAGALFVAFNLAPTEEMALISFRMTPWHGLALVLVSILLLHVFVYHVGFSGQEDWGDNGPVHTFFRFSIVGYAIAIAASLYIMWTIGRTDGANATEIAMMVAVLGFPAAIGAAIARLVV